MPSLFWRETLHKPTREGEQEGENFLQKATFFLDNLGRICYKGINERGNTFPVLLTLTHLCRWLLGDFTMARIYADNQATNATTNEQATTTQATNGERYTYDEKTKVLTVYGVKYKKDKTARQYSLDLTIDLTDATMQDLVFRAASSMVISFQGALRGKSDEFLQSLSGKNYRTTYKGLTAIYDPQKAVSDTLNAFGALSPEQQALLLAQLQKMQNNG